MPVQRLPVGRGQPHERLLVAALGGDEHSMIEGGRLHRHSGAGRRNGRRTTQLCPR